MSESHAANFKHGLLRALPRLAKLKRINISSVVNSETSSHLPFCDQGRRGSSQSGKNKLEEINLGYSDSRLNKSLNDVIMTLIDVVQSKSMFFFRT